MFDSQLEQPPNHFPKSPLPSQHQNENDKDNVFEAGNPFLLAIFGIAYLVIAIYTVKYCFLIVDKLWSRRRNGEVGDEENRDEEENESVYSERLPSMYKVIVLPNKDVCYGINKDQESNLTQETLAYLSSEEQSSNLQSVTVGDESSDIVEVGPIRMYRTSSVDLQSEFDLENEHSRCSIANKQENEQDVTGDTQEIQLVSTKL